MQTLGTLGYLTSFQALKDIYTYTHWQHLIIFAYTNNAAYLLERLQHCLSGN